MMHARVLTLALAAILAAVIHPTALAQPQAPPPKNLQVLPKDFTRDQVTAVMRGFTHALGVRCTHCHVGQDGNPQSMDFASDDKDEKKTAREMLKMVNTINTDVVRMVSGDDPKADVRCETCHRGRSQPPRPMADVLADTAALEGAEAAIGRYSALRAESLDAGQYDFRPRSVLAAARRLQDEKAPEAATALLKGAIALFPDSADVVASYGMALLQGGDRDGAKAQFDRALELDPKHGMAQQGLRRLQGGARP